MYAVYYPDTRGCPTFTEALYNRRREALSGVGRMYDSYQIHHTHGCITFIAEGETGSSTSGSSGMINPFTLALRSYCLLERATTLARIPSRHLQIPLQSPPFNRLNPTQGAD
jgi:hypothetical protein